MTAWALDSFETTVTLRLADPPAPALDDPSWREHAACKGRTRLFFAPKAERPQARERREAKARRLCESCPVRQPCQQFARANHEYGFWGGESEEERHLLGYTISAPIGIRARSAGARLDEHRLDEHLHPVAGS